MKIKLLLLLSAFSVTALGLAQIDSLCIKKKVAYRWQISAAINSAEAQMDQKLFDTWVYPSANYYAYYGNKRDRSFSFSIIPKYRISDNTLLRFELGLTNIDLRSHYDGIGDTATQNQGYIGGAAGIIKNDVIQQKIYRYLVGLQLTFVEKKHINGYCGATLNYSHYSKMNWSDYIQNISISGRSTNYTSTTAGGFAFGVGVLTGIKIHLNRQISLGSELSYSLLYYQLGGIQSGTTEEIFPASPKQTLNWKIHNNKSEGIQFTKVIPSLNLSIAF